MPVPPSPHGTENRWRTGCRGCAPCRIAHNEALRIQRHRRTEQRFSSAKRQRLLTLLAAGVHITDAAAALRTTQQRIHTYARLHPEWAVQLDDALMAGRDPDVPHGTPTGYRHYRCRCPECRRAHRNSS